MPPHDGLVHLKEYDIKDSNVEFIGTEIDHRVKYASAETEPAWNDGKVGKIAALHVWRIEDFEVVPWPKDRYGQFYDGDSYIVLNSYKVGDKDGQEKLGHEIFFWLGSKTSQDEAGTAAYKTVELDEFLKGAAVQHREIQQQPSDEFISLFSQIKILRGGVQSGFRHVDTDAKPKEAVTLLRVFKQPGAGRSSSMVVHEVEATWQSLDENDVFVLDMGKKIWVWQGKKCSPMEKARAAQIVNDLTIAKHIDVEVISQTESRSRIVVDLLGGKDSNQSGFQSPPPVSSSHNKVVSRTLFRLSDASGVLSFDLVKSGQPIRRTDLDSKDVFLLDTGRAIWVWRGQAASVSEKAMWMRIARLYVRQLGETDRASDAYLTPLASVAEGNESPAFFKVLEAEA